MQLRKDGVYVDATFGGGGHSRLILNQLGPSGKLFAFDQDADAVANAPKDERFTLIESNFRYLRRFLRFYGHPQVDGILADLGVSSHQLDVPERGFSFRFEAPLDMRMNARTQRTAADLVNDLDAEALQRVLGQFGEVRNARTLAKAIVEQRRVRPFRTIQDLLAVTEPRVRGARHRYLAQVFQALRMAVNRETEVLAEFLEQCHAALRPGGRLVVISYHSIEDRMVKNVLRTGNVDGRAEKDWYGRSTSPYRIVTRKAITPEPEELERNPRSRSAKLRIGEKIADAET